LKNKAYGTYLIIALIIVTSSSTFCQREAAVAQKLEDYVEIELGKLAETYRLLDRFAEDIWPGWDNYDALEVQMTFPNKIQVLVSPKKTQPLGYKSIRGRQIQGKYLFINRSNEIQKHVAPPLVATRGMGGFLVRLELGQLFLPPEETKRIQLVEKRLIAQSSKDIAFNMAPIGDTDGHILMLIHEHYHGYQAKFGSWGRGARGLRDFRVTADYAAYSHVEGLALKKAFEEKDQAEALEYFEDFCVARESKQATMPPEAVAGERFISVIEGTPSFCSLKMAMILRDESYEAGISRDADPFFYNFQYMEGYVSSLMEKGLEYIANLTLDKRGKYYLYGAYQCFLLDRFFPGWKKNFFENKKDLDTITDEFLALTEEQKKEISKRIEERYGFNEIYAKHEAVLKGKSQSEDNKL
jgi:hypothetical protein